MRTTYNASKIKGIEGYKKLTYADKGISFEVPSNWGLNRLFVQGNLIAIGPMQTRISIHLSIMSEYWDKVDSNLERYRSEKSGFKLLSDQATEIQGCSAREITYLFIDSEKGLAKKKLN